MGTHPTIAVLALLVALSLAALTGAWIAWAATVAAAVWCAWVSADQVMKDVMNPPTNRGETQAREP